MSTLLLPPNVRFAVIRLSSAKGSPERLVLAYPNEETLRGLIADTSIVGLGFSSRDEAACAAEAAEIRAFIKAEARDGMALHEKLKDNFGRTELGRAATDESWMTWVDDFLKQNATARNVALVFLEEKTGLKRGTLKFRFSAARNKHKMRK